MLRDVSQRLQASLGSIDDDRLAQPTPVKLPRARTLADALAFFALHDTYHVGQMAYIRKAPGYPRLVG